MIELITVIVGVAGSLFGLLKARQAGRQEEATTRLQIQLAEINARAQAEASDDAIMQRFLDMLEMTLTRVQTSYNDGIERIIRQSEASQKDILKAINTMNDQALILMSQTGKRRDDWQVLAMDTLEALPERTRQKLHESFKQVPPETGDLLMPRLDTVETVIVNAIDRLEKRMIERINPEADNALSIVQRDMKALKTDCSQIFVKINDIQSLLTRMKPPDPPLSPNTKPLPGQVDKTEDETAASDAA